MNAPKENIVYFIYDGECPLCKMGASFYQLKRSIGSLEIVDARTQTDHRAVNEVNAAGVSFDDGMVIKYDHKLYHGAGALHLMAKLGASRDLLNILNNTLYKSRFMVDISYPFMKAARNALLKIKGIDQIKNLES